MDPWIDPSTERVRAIHLDPLVAWLSRCWLGGAPVRLLDLGCGDMLLARLLADVHVVDGYDTSAAARDAARAASRRAGRAGGVFDEIGAVPVGAYDGVVISSVLQYVPDEVALTELLGHVARWLRPGASLGAVATDVPVPGGGRMRDALDLAVVLAQRLGPLMAMRELARAARRSPGGLSSFGETEVVACAGRAGMDDVRLEQNLSSFSSRSSYRFCRFERSDVVDRRGGVPLR